MSSDYRNYEKPFIAQPNQQQQVDAGKKFELLQKPFDKRADLAANTVSKEIFNKQSEATGPSNSIKNEHQFEGSLFDENLSEKVENAVGVLHFPVADQSPIPLAIMGQQMPNNISQYLAQEIPSSPESEEISKAENEPEEIHITPEQFAALTREELKELNLNPKQLNSLLESLTIEQLEQYILKTGELEEAEKQSVKETEESITRDEAVALHNKEIALQKDETALQKDETALQKDETALQRDETAFQNEALASKAAVVMSEETVKADKQESLAADEVGAVEDEISNLPSDIRHAYTLVDNEYIHVARLTPEQHQEVLKYPEKTIIISPDGVLKHAPGHRDKYSIGMKFSIISTEGKNISVTIKKTVEMTKEEHEAFQASLVKFLAALFPKPTTKVTNEENDKKAKDKNKTVELPIKQPRPKPATSADLNIAETTKDIEKADKERKRQEQLNEAKGILDFRTKQAEKKIEEFEEEMELDQDKTIGKSKDQRKIDSDKMSSEEPPPKPDNGETIEPKSDDTNPTPRSTLDV